MECFFFCEKTKKGENHMAATRLIALHINKGKTLAQCLKERTDYSENAEKTNGGQYISTYECDAKTADEEFLLSKRQYLHITGRIQRDDVIAYQIRQSFLPGEITPQEANDIGQELALRFTKGRHAFLVATHVDRAHIHNHIIFNSTTLDYKRKFKNFHYSAYAVRKISDLICIEHGLSVIQAAPVPDKKARPVYPERVSHRDLLKEEIERILLQRPKDFDEFLFYLSKAGYEIKYGTYTAVRKIGQERFIRFRSLGEDYSEAAIKKRLLPKHRMDFIVDIEKKLREGKGAGYERWAKNFNVKQMAQSILFLEEHGIRDFKELSQKADAYLKQFDELSSYIKKREGRLAEIHELQKHIVNYARTKEVYVNYRKAGYSKKFYEEHREEISLHQAAKEVFSPYGKNGLPKMHDLKEESKQLTIEKKTAYRKYYQVKKEMREYVIARKNLELILDESSKEQEEKNRKEQQEKNQEM